MSVGLFVIGLFIYLVAALLGNLALALHGTMFILGGSVISAIDKLTKVVKTPPAT